MIRIYKRMSKDECFLPIVIAHIFNIIGELVAPITDCID